MISLFAATLFVFSTSGGSSVPNRHGQAVLESVSIGLTRPFRRMDGGLMLGVHDIEQPASDVATKGVANDRVHGVSLSLLVRRHFAAEHGLLPYAEISSGPLWTDHRVPAGTSQFNFFTQAGGGVELQRAPIPLAIGLHFGHISNAGLAYHNPGVNVFSISTETAVRVRYK